MQVNKYIDSKPIQSRIIISTLQTPVITYIKKREELLFKSFNEIHTEEKILQKFGQILQAGEEITHTQREGCSVQILQ